jgi:hypothetical protein
MNQQVGMRFVVLSCCISILLFILRLGVMLGCGCMNISSPLAKSFLRLWFNSNNGLFNCAMCIDFDCFDLKKFKV